MLSILALLALWAPISGAPASVSPARQDAQELVLDQLEQALLGKNSENLVRALGRSARIRDLRVARASTLAVSNRNPRVQVAALDALRFNPHPRALPALHSLFKKKGLFKGQEEMQALLIRAIAQHGETSSLSMIAGGGLGEPSARVTRARILGMGHIHHRSAIMFLMETMKSMGRTERMLHMDEFRLSLTHLTTQDHGLSAQSWIRWWGQHKEPLRLRSQDDKLRGALNLEWERYWSDPAELPAQRKAPPTPRPKKRVPPQPPKKQGTPIEAGTKKQEKQPQSGEQKKGKPGGKDTKGKNGEDSVPIGNWRS